MKDKKGIELSMNVIIIAALALLVLVVIAIIFMVRAGIFAGETTKCENNQGVCKSSCTGASEIKKTLYWCDNDGDNNKNEGASVDGICCLVVPA